MLPFFPTAYLPADKTVVNVIIAIIVAHRHQRQRLPSTLHLSMATLPFPTIVVVVMLLVQWCLAAAAAVESLSSATRSCGQRLGAVASDRRTRHEKNRQQFTVSADATMAGAGAAGAVARSFSRVPSVKQALLVRRGSETGSADGGNAVTTVAAAAGAFATVVAIGNVYKGSSPCCYS